MTPAEIKQACNDIFNEVQNALEYGYNRWLDEREYEKIEDYAHIYRQIINEKGHKFIKMTKRPFGFIVKIDNQTIQYFCNKSNLGYRSVK
jgi:hypothetical protein